MTFEVEPEKLSHADEIIEAPAPSRLRLTITEIEERAIPYEEEVPVALTPLPSTSNDRVKAPLVVSGRLYGILE